MVADYAETPDSIFANARTTTPAPQPRLRVTPGVENFSQSGPRRFQLSFRWDVQEPIPTGYVPFVHVTGKGAAGTEDILFQFGSGLPAVPETWPVGEITQGAPLDVTLPEALPDGTYALKVGLYKPLGGDRLRLTGPDDGNHRFTLGTLVVSDGGNTIRWQPVIAGTGGQLSPERAAHTNIARKMVHFGKIATDGSVSLERTGPGVWRLIPFPRTQPFSVALNAARIDPKLLPLHLEALDADGHSLGAVSSHPTAALPPGWTQFRVNTIPGATAYRLAGTAP